MSAAEHRRLLVIAAAYAALLVALSLWIHPASIVGGEADPYAERGARLLEGRLDGDRFHPFLYPELIAIVLPFVGDEFVAARAVAAVAGGAFLYASYRFARALFGPAPAGWTAALLAGNGGIVLLGIRAVSDLPAAAFFVASLWLLLAAPYGRWRWFAAGCCFGLATATRLNFAALVPLFVGVAAAIAPRGARLGTALRFALGCGIGYLPNAVPSLLAHGTPLPTDNWRNMAFKLSSDPEHLFSPPYAGLADLLRSDGARLCELGIADFAHVWTVGMGVCLSGEAAVWPVAAALTWLTLVGAAWFAAIRPWRETLIVFAALLAYSGLVALTFFPQPRLFVPLAPIALLPILALPFAVFRHRRLVAHAICATLFVAVATSVAPVLRAHMASFPVAEVTAARELVRRDGPLTTIVSFYGPMVHQLDAAAIYVPHLPRGERGAAAVYRRVAATLGERPADYLVVGPRSCDAATPEELRGGVPVGWVVERCDADVVVVRLPRPAIAWLAQASVAFDAAGRLVLEIRTEDVPVLAAGFTVHPPDGAPFLLPLPLAAERTFRTTLPLAPDARGAYRFVPSCVLTTGAALRGPERTLTLPR